MIESTSFTPFNKHLKPIHTNQHLQNLEIRQNKKGYGVTTDPFFLSGYKRKKGVWFMRLDNELPEMVKLLPVAHQCFRKQNF